MSYLEITVLIIAIFSYSYLIYSQVNRVEAQEIDSLNCCEKTKSGLFCQNSSADNCDNTNGLRVAPSDCAFTDFCEIGCCISNNNGLCTNQVPKSLCNRLNGSYEFASMCNVERCRYGCCIIGNQAIWTTQENCKFEGNSKNKDIPTEWKTDEKSDSELECLFTVERGKEGACVYEKGAERKCIFTTLEDCVSRTGDEKNFNKEGKYCSDPSLNTTCKAKDHKACLEGKEDVYWFDSCGNHEDSAEDCNLFQGSFCGKDDFSKYFCKDVNCIVHGVERKNGESWCEYDGKIGDGKDPVGSRHVKHICYMGTERIEPCSDYRNEICVQTDGAIKDGKVFSQASCRVNNWRLCLSYNSKKGEAMESKCKKNPDCVIKHINMGSGFNFKVCVPAYPPGFNLGDEPTKSNEIEYANSGESICSIATQRCTETWICGIFGCWCVENCDCHTMKFTRDMNDLCISLGDCGAKANYIGVFTDGGYSLKSTGAAPPRLGGSEKSGLTNYGRPQPGQKPAEPGTYEFFETTDAEGLEEVTDEGIKNQLSNNSNGSAMLKELEGVIGAYGSPLLYKILEEDAGNITDDEITRFMSTSRPVNAVGYFNGISSVRSSISAQITKKDKKVGGFEMIGALIAGAIAYLLTQSILITMMAAMLAYLFLIMWIMYVDIDFYCDVWERPDGGADCNKCNTGDVPCSEYRCQSLGQLCTFENKGTPNELCLARPANESFPFIEPLLSVISPGYKYANIKENSFELLTQNDSCIDPFNLVRLGIKVSPFAKCKFGYDRKQSYQEMPEKFGLKGNSVLPAHQLNLVLPSISSIIGVYGKGAICNVSGQVKPCNLSEADIKEMGSVNLYVKCKTGSGKINPEPYLIKTCVNKGPDLTAPRIWLTHPVNKAHIKYNSNEENVTIFVNEPSECKWSLENKNYGEMENQMECDSDVTHFGQYGLPCTTTLKETRNNTKYYIRCQDLSENHNNMTESFVYEFRLSESPLIIEEIRPDNEARIVSGVEPARVMLKLVTSGGAENGKAVCEWFGPDGNDRFTATNNSEHSYEWTRARQGRHTVNFRCEDAAGNLAKNVSSFIVMIDKYGPYIARAYNYGELKIVTDERARCKYSLKRLFNFENATDMDTSLTYEHSAPWKYVTYYIQCIDEYNNLGTKMTLRPYDTNK